MERDTLIDIAYGKADIAEVATGLRAPRPAPAVTEMSRLDRAVTAGLITFVTFLWAAVLLLAAGWLADLFLAALPWSLALYLVATVAAAAAIGLKNWRAGRPPASTGRLSAALEGVADSAESGGRPYLVQAIGLLLLAVALVATLLIGSWMQEDAAEAPSARSGRHQQVGSRPAPAPDAARREAMATGGRRSVHGVARSLAAAAGRTWPVRVPSHGVARSDPRPPA